MSEVSLHFFSCKGPLFYLIFFKQYVQRDKYLLLGTFFWGMSLLRMRPCVSMQVYVQIKIQLIKILIKSYILNKH